jgi:Holliday junction resolvase RusA-like endonuclease
MPTSDLAGVFAPRLKQRLGRARSDATRRLAARAIHAVRRLTLVTAVSVFIAIKPVPASRPRLSHNGHAYTAQPYAGFAGELQRELALAHTGDPMLGPLVVGVEVVKDRPKKTILTAPLGDVDNHVKGPLDAATKTGRFWKDDVQIEHLFCTKRWAELGEPQGIHLTVNTLEG